MADWFDFAGVRSTSLGVYVQDFPPVTLAEERAKFEPIPGRSGSLTFLEGDAVYDDIVLSVDCFVRDLSALDQIAAWLRGSGVLVLGCMPDRCYKARCVNQIELAKVLRGREHRTFPAVFRCSPYRYIYPQPASLTYRPLVNLISNGEFSAGTTGWGALDCTLSAANNVLEITGSGTGVSPRTTRSIAFVQDHVYYGAVEVKSLSALCIRMDMYVLGDVSAQGPIIAPPTINTNYRISANFTANATATSNFRVKADYASAANSNGAKINVRRVMLIDLTAAFGAGSEPTAAQMDAIMAYWPNSWFDGTATSGSIINPGTADAYPLITIVGSGDVTLTIGVRALTVTGLASQITFDTETGYALDGAGNDLTDTVSLDAWPMKIPPGTSAISYTGTVTSVTITRPWRYI